MSAPLAIRAGDRTISVTISARKSSSAGKAAPWV